MCAHTIKKCAHTLILPHTFAGNILLQNTLMIDRKKNSYAHFLSIRD